MNNDPVITCLHNSSGYRSLNSTCLFGLGVGFFWFDLSASLNTSMVPVCVAAAVRILTKDYRNICLVILHPIRRFFDL